MTEHKPLVLGWVMGPIGWILLGALAGWLAGKVFTDAERPRGCLAYTVIGIVGAFIGGLIMTLIGGAGVTGFNLYSIFVAVLGSIVLLWIVRLVRR